MNHLLIAAGSDSVVSGGALRRRQYAQTREMLTFSWRSLMSFHNAYASCSSLAMMSPLAIRSLKLMKERMIPNAWVRLVSSGGSELLGMASRMYLMSPLVISAPSMDRRQFWYCTPISSCGMYTFVMLSSCDMMRR